MRQLRMQRIAIRLTSRSAVLSFESSALRPDFSDLVEGLEEVLVDVDVSRGQLILTVHWKGDAPGISQ